MKKKRDCKKHRYHDWEVSGVIGNIGEEQVELSCECGAEAIADVNMITGD